MSVAYHEEDDHCRECEACGENCLGIRCGECTAEEAERKMEWAMERVNLDL